MFLHFNLNRETDRDRVESQPIEVVLALALVLVDDFGRERVEDVISYPDQSSSQIFFLILAFAVMYSSFLRFCLDSGRSYSLPMSLVILINFCSPFNSSLSLSL